MSTQRLLAILIFLQQAIHYEYTEVVSDTKYECRQNNIYNIELHVENRHETEYDNPADTHRKEGKECQFQTAI